MTNIRLAAVTVLYQPNETVINNINSYINTVDKLYLVDNSLESTESLWESLLENEKVVYLPNRKNLGIAAALNIGAQKALSDNFTWLLTMDQDSSFESNMLSSYIQMFNHQENKNKVSIISPQQSYQEYLTWKSSSEKTDIMECNAVMTSGNILNLQVYSSIGGFEEKLFIDEVDHDYCLKSKISGYRVLKYCSVHLSHQLGKSLKVKKHGRMVNIADHSHIRMYYITRNNLYIWKKYSKYFPDYIRERQKQFVGDDIINLILYKDSKFKKMYYMFKGLVDFMRGRYGEYEQ